MAAKTTVPPLPDATEEIMVAIKPRRADRRTGGAERPLAVRRRRLPSRAPAGTTLAAPSRSRALFPALEDDRPASDHGGRRAEGRRRLGGHPPLPARSRPGREVLTLSLNSFEKDQAPPEIQKDDIVVVGKSQAKAFWFGVYDFFKGVLGVSKPL